MHTTTEWSSVYCERVSSAFWAEPLNALTNLAFILAAWAVVRLLRAHASQAGPVQWDLWLLAALMALVGGGSFVWHTLAAPWSKWADVLPIFLFISVFLHSFLLRVARLRIALAVGWFVLLLTASAGLMVALPRDFLNGSVAYLPTLAALWLLAWHSRRSGHAGASALGWAGLVFSFSLLLRTVDRGVCPLFPLGTHLFWHVLNGLTLYLALRGLLGVELRLHRLWWRAGVALLMMALAFVAGPRVSLAVAVQPPSLPHTLTALETTLHTQEARQPNLVPGAEKTIVWADPARKARTPLAIVYLHGFSASRQEIAPVVDQLAARLGANLYYTRLTGHGRDGAAMTEATVNDWVQDGVEALAVARQLGERVIVVATSTGGTLATWLLAHGYDQDIAAAMLISPNFAPRDAKSELLLWPWGATIARAVAGPTWRLQPLNDINRRYWTNEFPVAGLLPMMGMVEVTRRSELSRIQTPVLVIYSRQDKVVNSSATERQFARFGSVRKQLVRLDHSSDPKSHVLAGDAKSPATNEEVRHLMLEFWQSLQAPQLAQVAQ